MVRLPKQTLYTTAGMLAVMSMLSAAVFTVAVFAPDAATDIGLDPTWVGAFTSLVYLVAMFSGISTTTMVARFGGIRVCQGALGAIVIAMLLVTHASPLSALIAALLIGVAYGTFNPTSAHLLFDNTPERWRPLVFSVKQAGVPLGGIIAGFSVPLLISVHSWQLSAWVTAALAASVALIITPLGVDPENHLRKPYVREKRSWSEPLRLVLGDSTLRVYLVLSFIYAGVQVSISAFFVLYLVESVGMGLTEAGLVFATLQAGGVFGRLIWGGVASWLESPSQVLTLIGLTTALTLGMASTITLKWPLLLVLPLAFVLGTASSGWNGVLLSEVARLSPEGQSTETTGGVQFLMYSGVVAVPSLFAAGINLAGNYQVPFLITGLLAMVAGIWLASSTKR